MKSKRRGGWKDSRGLQIVPSGMMDDSDMARTAAAVAAGAAAGAGLMWAAHKYNWFGMGKPAVATRPPAPPPASTATPPAPPATPPAGAYMPFGHPRR